MIQLREIDHHNWLQSLELDVKEEQRRYISPNIFSLAEAFVHSGIRRDADEYYRCIPFSIYYQDEMIGFAMITYEAETDYDQKPAYELYRIMIDQKHQGKGYGRNAVELLLDYINTFPCGAAEYVYATWHPENTVSQRLFETFHFSAVGTDEDGAVIARLRLNG